MSTLRQNPLLRARIVEGRVSWHGLDGKRWEAVKKFLEGQEVEISIGKWQKKRTGKQLRYYWAVIVAMIAEAAGYATPEEAHDALRMHFLLKHEEGKPPTLRSTGDMTTVEIEDYYAKCRQLGAEIFGIYIPEPNEVITE